MRKCILIFAMMLVGSVVNAQSHTNADEAFKIASESQRVVLLIFSGSDWCAPCVEFDKKVIQQETFQNFAAQSLVILKADFPQRSKLSRELETQNEKLASLYNPKGIFPMVLLLRGDKSLIATIPVKHQNADEFITDVKRLLLPTP